jgi:uncharacterized protein (TIGR00251 family)
VEGFYTVRAEEIRVRVKVKPGSGANCIVGVRGDELIVKVKARAEKDRANRELIDFLAEWAGIPRKDVAILSGARSRRKTVSLSRAAEAAMRKVEAI